jgi:hypothetical protein
MAEFANEVAIGKSAASATEGVYDDANRICVGKKTLSEQLPPADPAAIKLQQVRARAGTQFDDAGYTYEVTPEAAFRIVKATPHPASKDVVITMTGKWAPAWMRLADVLEAALGSAAPAAPAAPALADAAPALANATPVLDEAKPAATTAGSATKPSEPATTPPAGEPAAGAVSGSDLFFVATDKCLLRNETGKEVGGMLAFRQHVRVLDKTVKSSGWTIAKVASADAKSGGAELGWVSLSHLHALMRPARPSTSAKQMAALLSASQAVAGARPSGRCYHFVKQHILAAGGYGDILDIINDERFVGCQIPAVSFHAAVERAGAAAMGLELVSGLPKDAAVGTLLVLQGNGKAKLSMEYGDISVIAAHEKGSVICFNDGRMPLIADEKAWGPGGHMEGTLLAMYRPIDRA